MGTLQYLLPRRYKVVPGFYFGGIYAILAEDIAFVKDGARANIPGNGVHLPSIKTVAPLRRREKLFVLRGNWGEVGQGAGIRVARSVYKLKLGDIRRANPCGQCKQQPRLHPRTVHVDINAYPRMPALKLGNKELQPLRV